MPIYLEHANIAVPDIDQAIAFLCVIEPSFYVRCDELSKDGRRWVHVGNQQVYIALQEATSANPQYPQKSYDNYGVNHLAWVVDDFDMVVQRLEQKGYKAGIAVKPHPYRKRAYYYDHAGFEWEIVQYLSSKNEERNSYEPE